jgi:hypothetical protein
VDGEVIGIGLLTRESNWLADFSFRRDCIDIERDEEPKHVGGTHGDDFFDNEDDCEDFFIACAGVNLTKVMKTM